MNLEQMPNHWTPMEFHGVIPYPNDGLIEKAVRQALRTNLPKTFRNLTFSKLKYFICTAGDGSQQLVFEVQE